MKTVLIIIISFSLTLSALAQNDSGFTRKAELVDKESAAEVEIGGAIGKNLHDGGLSSGPNIALEVTPIENWLELEAGITPAFAAHSTEWDIDFLLKKPWALSPKAEFMLGVGALWVHMNELGVATHSVGGEVSLDFQFWPSAKHRFGWYLEPGYEYNFGRGHEQSVGLSGGLVVAIP